MSLFTQKHKHYAGISDNEYICLSGEAFVLCWMFESGVVHCSVLDLLAEEAEDIGNSSRLVLLMV